MIERIILIIVISVLLKVVQNRKRIYSALLASVYVFLVVSITLFSERDAGAVSTVDMDVLQKYIRLFTTSWIGDGKYIAREIIGNVILFIPLGQLLSSVFRGKHLLLIAMLGFLVSLAIETTQHHYGLGTFEVADLIHNTIGAVCGYYIYKTDFYLKGQELWSHIRSRFLRR